MSLSNFRNYRSGELTLQPGINILLGKNGQGKTNLAEAIMYFASLKSHRIAQDSALITEGEDSAVVRMKMMHNQREALVETQINRVGANRAQINRHPVKSRELTHMVSAVLFAPEDLWIVRGDPASRRRFLDDALSSRYPLASGVLSDYDRVLRQRNALLRDARGRDLSTSMAGSLAAWDQQLVDLGSQIVQHRRMLVQDVLDPLKTNYNTLVDDDHLPGLALEESVLAAGDVSRETLTNATRVQAHVSRETIASDFYEALQRHQSRELERGQTLFGPHRDDLALTLNGLPVKGYASHGETWSFILSLKLALSEILREESQTGDPVLVLDDVFAELDTHRRDRLMESLKQYEQVIITAAVGTDVPELEKWNVVRISGGTIEVNTCGEE